MPVVRAPGRESQHRPDGRAIPHPGLGDPGPGIGGVGRLYQVAIGIQDIEDIGDAAMADHGVRVAGDGGGGPEVPGRVGGQADDVTGPVLQNNLATRERCAPARSA